MINETEALPPIDTFDNILNACLFDASLNLDGIPMRGILPFAELEIAVRDDLYAPARHLERRELPLEEQVERLLRGGLVTLAKTAVMNGLPTDTALAGELDKALYQACISRLETQRDRWQPEGAIPDEVLALIA